MTVPRIAVVGSTMIDLIAYARRVPSGGETIQGDDFRLGFGGKGANQAVMARLLGAEVAMVNALGDDVFGDMTMRNFAEHGIDTRFVTRVAGSSGVAPIWVEPDGTNRIICVAGANDAMVPADAADAVRALAPLDVVVGQFEIPQAVTTAAFEAARTLGAITVLNPAPAADLDPALLALTDWLIPNESEFARIAGATPAATDEEILAFARSTGSRVVVTLGARGAALLDAHGVVQRIPAPSVSAVDTTGAGDAFVGGFAFGLATGLSDLDAVALGIRCASDSVQRPGTQRSFPDRDRARSLLSPA
ncbi:MAG TPA: ribokinase [Candidatus Limnocylindrales bacterium]|nr:ribokinase [Candidatus Limnocylindrales bacterium]